MADNKNTPPVSGSSGSSGNAAATPITSPSQPAGTPPGTGDAGSDKNLKKTEEKKEQSQADRDATARKNEETDKDTGVVTRTVEDKDGNETIISSVSSEEADKHQEKLKTTPVFENLTQSLLGVPGNVNLTQDGTLAGDKSVRDERSIEEINEEIEAKAGPNPLPNREGNELTKAANFIATATGTGTLGSIDRKTNVIAKELKELSKKNSLSKEDKDRLEAMSKQLEDTGKVPVA